ncbi:MAG: redoxin domain-containing protein [Ferruginibacter sp.]
MPVTIGEKAPNFSLYNTDKIKMNLSDVEGKNVVLLFFPLAFSSVCTKEMCDVRDNISAYNTANAQVFGVSVDSLYVLKKFKEDQSLTFTLLSDFNKEAAKAYDVLYETFPGFEMKGVSKRAAFVIDKQGLIQYAEVCASPGNLPDFDAIEQTLQKIN